MKHYLSDPHFDHTAVLEKGFSNRQFPSIDAHNDFLIDMINSHVDQRQDELFLLGDICYGARVGHFRHRIRCRRVYLIYGNHDKRSIKQFFSTAQEVLMTKVKTQPCWLSHYPHAYWPQSHYGSFHLYGHLHDQREKTLDEIWPNRRSMDVGVDTAKRVLGEYRPFSEDEIYDLLISKSGHDPVEWYRSQNGEITRGDQTRSVA